jgi:hypothetical protein
MTAKTRANAVALAFLIPTILVAASPPPLHRSTHKPALILQWKDRLRVANAHLQRSDWKEGRDVADAVRPTHRCSGQHPAFARVLPRKLIRRWASGQRYWRFTTVKKGDAAQLRPATVART